MNFPLNSNICKDSKNYNANEEKEKLEGKESKLPYSKLSKICLLEEDKIKKLTNFFQEEIYFHIELNHFEYLAYKKELEKNKSKSLKKSKKMA